MTRLKLRVPVDVVETLKELAPKLGYSGYQPLIKAYVGEGLRRDEATLYFWPSATPCRSAQEKGRRCGDYRGSLGAGATGGVTNMSECRAHARAFHTRDNRPHQCLCVACFQKNRERTARADLDLARKRLRDLSETSMTEQTFASVWDALEDSPEVA